MADEDTNKSKETDRDDLAAESVAPGASSIEPAEVEGDGVTGETEVVLPSELIEADEGSIREELGIGVESSEESIGIDSLLEDATVGYEQVFAGTALDPRGSGELHTTDGSDDDEAAVASNLDLLRDVNMKVKVELGRGQMRLRDILRLSRGSVVELEKLAGDALDIYVNDKVIARGEVLVLNENFCIRLTEIFSPKEILAQKT